MLKPVRARPTVQRFYFIKRRPPPPGRLGFANFLSSAAAAAEDAAAAASSPRNAASKELLSNSSASWTYREMRCVSNGKRSFENTVFPRLSDACASGKALHLNHGCCLDAFKSKAGDKGTLSGTAGKSTYTHTTPSSVKVKTKRMNAAQRLHMPQTCASFSRAQAQRQGTSTQTRPRRRRI